MHVNNYTEGMEFITKYLSDLQEKQLHELSQSDRKTIKAFIEAKPGKKRVAALPNDLKERVRKIYQGQHLSGTTQSFLVRASNWVLNKLGFRIGIKDLPIKRITESELFSILANRPKPTNETPHFDLKKELISRGYAPILFIEKDEFHDIDTSTSINIKIDKRIEYADIDFSGIVFEKMNLPNCTFSSCIFTSTVFNECRFLESLSFLNCTLENTDFINCTYKSDENRPLLIGLSAMVGVNFDIKPEPGQKYELALIPKEGFEQTTIMANNSPIFLDRAKSITFEWKDNQLVATDEDLSTRRQSA